MKCRACGHKVLNKLDTPSKTFRGIVYIGIECDSCKQRDVIPKPKRKPRKKKESKNGPDSNSNPADN